MTLTKPDQKLKILKYISDGFQRNEQLAEVLEKDKSRVSQIIGELKDDDLVMVEHNIYKLTRNGYKLVDEEFYSNLTEISKYEDKVLVEDVVVYFLVSPVKDRTGKGWRDKIAEVKDNEYIQIREDPSEYVRVQEYNQVLLKPDAVQVNLGKIYAENLIAAKDEAMERATDILDKIEKQSEESLNTSEARFDGFLTYQSIKSIEKPPSFYFGEESVTTSNILEEGDEGGRHHISASEDDDYFEISLPMSEPRRRDYNRLKKDMRGRPGKYLQLIQRVQEIEQKLDRLGDR
jgi:hypothetical protein